MSISNFMDYGLGYYGKGCQSNTIGPNRCNTPGGPGLADYMVGTSVFAPISGMAKRSFLLARQRQNENVKRAFRSTDNDTGHGDVDPCMDPYCKRRDEWSAKRCTKTAGIL